MSGEDKKLMTEMKTSVRVMVVTNDSTVFRSKGVDNAFNMFGGRVTEVKNLVARLDTAVDEKGRICVWIKSIWNHGAVNWPRMSRSR